ncbi:MAG: phosphotransferase [Pseudomonadales bacterium]|nr:phosphotransferase [Pseudomonadales bacterium]
MAPLQGLRDFRRLKELLGILILYGFDDLLQWMGLGRQAALINRLLRRKLPADVQRLPPQARARMAMEEMGPTFVKLGQILATRVDLLPPEWITELEKLQSRVAAVPFSELLPGLEASLGRSVAEVFSEVEEHPLGSASMAQVHRARLKSGERVVLKIRRPGIRALIEADMRLLEQVAAVAESQSPDWRRFQPVALLREFQRSLARELDFAVEARAAERIANNLATVDYMVIPKVYWDYTCEDLNVQEAMNGTQASDLAELDRLGVDRLRLARRGAAVVWKMMLEDGFFHADPHPGNFIILPDERIALIDFGMVGRLSAQRRDQLVRLVRGILLQEPEVTTHVLVEWSAGYVVQREALNSEVAAFMERFDGVPLDQLDIAGVLQDVAAILRHHAVSLPADIALIVKACLTLEGFGRSLAPNFQLMEEAAPLLKKTLRGRYAPQKLARAMRIRALDMVEKVYNPNTMATQSHLIGSAPPINPMDMERWIGRLERAHARQTTAQLITAMYVVGGLLSLLPQGPHMVGMNVLGIVFIMSASVYGFWLWLSQWWTLRGRD